jgi:cytochrome b
MRLFQRKAMSVNYAAKAAIRLQESRPMLAVWDPFVRIFHWLLVAALTVALVTSLWLPPTWVNAHVIAGTSAAVLVAARIVWGFLGPSTARFSGFIRGPRVVLHHLTELKTGAGRRHLGHNPLGAAMILALLATVLAVAASGTVALGGVIKSGPLAFASSFVVGEAARQIHALLAYGLLVLIGLHVAGAIFESRRTGENLVRSMIDGRKELRAGDAVPARRKVYPVAAAAIAASLFVVSTAALATLANRPALGVPTKPLDPVYASECGDCHVAYHPSLAPAETWRALMAGLSDHFGEDASLDPGTAQTILAYLTANSADAFDTRAANVFRRRNPDDPLSITATSFWRHRHARIPDRVFAAPAVASRGNCDACHADAASGLFRPSAIAIPEDAEP